MIDYKNLKLVPVEEIPLGKDFIGDDFLSLYKLAVYMENLCFKNEGIGLSATQIGVPLNFFIILKPEGNEYYVNSIYEGIGEKIKSIEGCLSLKDKNGNLRRFEVERYQKIRFKSKKLCFVDQLYLEDVDKEVEGLFSIVFQHEIDHSHQILISDIGKEIRIF